MEKESRRWTKYADFTVFPIVELLETVYIDK